MAWTLDGIRIFTQESTKTWDGIMAELNPLAGGSIVHNFGYSEEKRQINVFAVGLTDEAALAALTTTGSAVTLSGPYGASDYLVKNVASAQMPGVTCQTLRIDLPDDDPVFVVDVELWVDA